MVPEARGSTARSRSPPRVREIEIIFNDDRKSKGASDPRVRRTRMASRIQVGPLPQEAAELLLRHGGRCLLALLVEMGEGLGEFLHPVGVGCPHAAYGELLPLFLAFGLPLGSVRVALICPGRLLHGIPGSPVRFLPRQCEAGTTRRRSSSLAAGPTGTRGASGQPR